MPISQGAISPTQTNPYSMIAANSMPSAGSNIPSFNLAPVQMASIDPNSITANPSTVYSLLARQPQSLTQSIGPLLQQVFGAQSNMMQPIFQQQGAQGAAQAQSDAMRRGLTGSSIEAMGIGQAYSAANQNYSQYLAQQLSSLIPTYASAVGQDIQGNNNYYTNLAQAVGQQYSAQQQKEQFEQQLRAALSQARMSAEATRDAGMMQAFGGAIGGIFSDVRLKKNLYPFAKWKGMTMFLFNYKIDKLSELPDGIRVGFLAHEVAKYRPDCVAVDRGYLKVDYNKLFNVPKELIPVA